MGPRVASGAICDGTDAEVLARKIAGIIDGRGLTQTAAAEILEVDQPKVSALIRGRLAGFSLDRFVRFLVLLGSDVEIVIKRRPKTARTRASWSHRLERSNWHTTSRPLLRAVQDADDVDDLAVNCVHDDVGQWR